MGERPACTGSLKSEGSCSKKRVLTAAQHQGKYLILLFITTGATTLTISDKTLPPSGEMCTYIMKKSNYTLFKGMSLPGSTPGGSYH